MNLALPTGVAAGVARLFLGWQLPPYATPVDPPLGGYLMTVSVISLTMKAIGKWLSQ